MTNILKRKELKPRGKPFARGTDPRRHLDGSKSRDVLDFKGEFKRIFSERADVGKLVDVLLARAYAGQPWALAEAFDRGLGKAHQAHSLELEHTKPLQVLYPGDPETDLIITAHDVKALPEAGASNQAGEGPLVQPGANGAVETGQDDPDDDDYIDACKKA
ncbi:MAG: hypothetical protein IMZ57_11860 [Acidobacteria bacterium]|nr:hypothetical protein [Acidobacteriota bacterium]